MIPIGIRNHPARTLISFSRFGFISFRPPPLLFYYLLLCPWLRSKTLNPKISKQGKSRREANAITDRKFANKIEFYAKVKDSVASLNATKSISKILSEEETSEQAEYILSEFLPELKAQQLAPAADLKLNSIFRRKLLVKEVERMKLVLNHQAFRTDPLGAFLQHLQSTQPPVDESAKKTKKDGGKMVAQKKKKSKSSAGIQPMDL